MAVRIRLRRMGAKKQPVYRVVVADSRSPRDGRFLDTIGTYNPRTDPADIRIDAEKALQWLEQGAEPTDSARSLLSKAGVWQRFRGEEGPPAGAGEAPAGAQAGPRPTPATPAERTAPPPAAAAPEEGSLEPPPDAFSADAPAGPVEDPRRKPEVVEELPSDAPKARTESQDPVATERREAEEE